MHTRTPVRVVVTRDFAAMAERVFDAWLSREMLGRWMFGPAVRDEEIVHLAINPHVGGTFSFLVERGDEQIDHVGKYLEMDRPRRLAFSWIVADEKVGSRVVVDISPTAKGCQLTLTHELHPDWAEFASRTEAAWNKMFDALAFALR